jgi:hypothetical protein
VLLVRVRGHAKNREAVDLSIGTRCLILFTYPRHAALYAFPFGMVTVRLHKGRRMMTVPVRRVHRVAPRDTESDDYLIGGYRQSERLLFDDTFDEPAT